MKKITLSNGITVSPICLGSMMFGTTTPKNDAFAILDAFCDLGGNFIDTANNYAHWIGTGDESELLLGEWLKERGCRDKVVVSTKVGFDRKGKGAGLKKEQIEYWIDESLKKLGTDYIDIYYAHTDDTNTPLEETAEAFHSLIKKGKVRAIGGSNYDTWRFNDFNNIADKNGWTPYTAMQQKFSYLIPNYEKVPDFTFNEPTDRERLRFLEAKNIPLIANSCLLGGCYEDTTRLPSDYLGGERLERIQNLAKEKGVSATALNIAWMLNLHNYSNYPVVIPLFSSSKLSHFVSNCKAVDIVITPDEMEFLNK